MNDIFCNLSNHHNKNSSFLKTEIPTARSHTGLHGGASELNVLPFVEKKLTDGKNHTHTFSSVEIRRV